MELLASYPTKENLMCDYSLHAVATRPAVVGETIVSTAFRGTLTRGFASECDKSVAVCLLPGTELAFEGSVKHKPRSIWRWWSKNTGFKLGVFNKIENNAPDRHHDAIEFPDGSHALVSDLIEGQRATVLQLPAKAVPSKLPEETQAFPEGDLGISREGGAAPAAQRHRERI